MNFERLGDSPESDDESSVDDSFFEDDDSLDSGIADEYGFGAGSNTKKRITEGTMIIIAALIIAGGSLYGMRLLGSKAGAIANDATLEARVVEFLDGFSDHTDLDTSSEAENLDPTAILDSLANDRTQKQIPIDFVKKNPFVRLEEQTNEVALPIDVPEEIIDPMVLRLEELQDIADSLLLTSILGSKTRRIATIEDEVVQVGDQLVVDDEPFTITRIDPFEVHLEADGFEFVVSLEQ